MNKRFKPQYLPYNNDAHALVEALAVELGLSLKGITGGKHKTILASFLHCVQEAGVGAYLDWSGGTTSQDTTGFSFFPATGSSTVVKVRTKLVDAGYVILGADLLARELPAELQELIGEPTQRERKRDINSYRINEMPLLDDPRLTSALSVSLSHSFGLSAAASMNPSHQSIAMTWPSFASQKIGSTSGSSRAKPSTMLS